MSGLKKFDVDDALDTAMRVFWTHSYANASLQRLSAATGLGKGSLYGTFRSKDALFGLALRRYGSFYGARYDRVLAEHAGNPVEAIAAFFEITVDRIGEPSVPSGCLIAQSAIEHPELGTEGRDALSALMAVQRVRIRQALAPSSAPEETIEELTLFVFAVNQSLAVLSRGGSSVAELRSVTSVAVRAVADALERPRLGLLSDGS